ncbi:uroporphyrinogen-III synthase [Acinetobacter puyangensis]|uniref:uroporphyrinogen-III synthase n=1 Tax=Acinetobacter puyangensis TaxID=1096779 RepID=UPI003A4E47BC
MPMQIFNTRPQARAQPLNQALQALGYEVFELPLLALKPLPLDAALRSQFQAFCSADIVVVVSHIAAQLGVQYYRELGLDMALLQQKKWIAVGRSTQLALQEYALHSECPKVETSEGMLQLEVLHHLQDKTIAFWRGIGGRTLMMQHLQKQGCHIQNILLYSRQCPQYNPVELAIKFSHLPAIILISSEESWKNWLLLCQDFIQAQKALGQNIYIVLGDRVTQVLQHYFCDHNVVATILTVHHLDAHTIHQRLQQHMGYE